MTTIQPPIIFDDYLETVLEDGLSPFISPSSRSWGHNLSLKSSLLAAFCLIISFILSFFSEHLSLSFVFLIFTYFLVGTPAVIDTVENLLHFNINIEMLMTLAAFSSILIGNPLEGALLLVLFALSGAIERHVAHKARGALRGLNKITPKTAHLITPDGSFHTKSICDIPKGAKILVKSGEMIPLDGDIISGTSSLDMVHLTGERLPQTKGPGDSVPSGAYNLEGAFILEITHTSSDSTLAKIIQLITIAQEAKPKTQRFFDKYSKSYATTIICLSAVFAASLPFFQNIPLLGPEGSIYRALSFLIAASPCALILAIPISYLSAVGACARKGILLKGGVVLDALASCSSIAFDKTGTLTTGNLQVLGVEPIYGKPLPEKQLWSLALALERNTVHPIANTIVEHCKTHHFQPAIIEDFVAIPGQGLRAVHQGKITYIGHIDHTPLQIPHSDKEKLQTYLAQLKKNGEILSLFSYGETMYLFRFKDCIRPEMPSVLQILRSQQHMHCIMLTGDHINNAEAIAKTLGGLDEIHANLKPQDKLNFITQSAQNKHIAMVGDGVNDAPALARATVGIAMGTVGSSTTIDISDIVLLRDDLHLLSWLVKKAHATQKIVKQNLFIAMTAILFASSLALAGWIPLWLAVILHEGGTVIVGLNGLRLLKR